MNRLLPLPALLLILGLLSGCTSYDTQVVRNHSLDGLQRYFVQGNSNDNHAIDHNIVVALKARGYEADTGPLTMMPDDAQAIISYQDHWSWDFGDRLAYLQITVRDPKNSKNLATVTFSTRFPSGKPLTTIVDELVGKLRPPK